MNTKDRRSLDAPIAPRKSDSPRKRFRIQKLEERIAPKKGGKGTNNCGGGSSNDESTVSIY